MMRLSFSGMPSPSSFTVVEGVLDVSPATDCALRTRLGRPRPCEHALAPIAKKRPMQPTIEERSMMFTSRSCMQHASCPVVRRRRKASQQLRPAGF